MLEQLKNDVRTTNNNVKTDENKVRTTETMSELSKFMSYTELPTPSENKEEYF